MECYFLTGFSCLLTIFVLVMRVQIASAVPIDNGIDGYPEIICGDNTIGLFVTVRNPFEGHVFVKGHYHDPGCKTDQTNLYSTSIDLPFSTCGVTKTRSANPAGVYVETTIVVSFHPQFVTKVDRAYAVQCFYMEAEKSVSSELEVSMLTTVVETHQVAMPTCTYEVLDHSATGPPAKYTIVGQQVYHKWTCSTESAIFCMTVHSCFVDDGLGTRIQLLDNNGCSLDRYLLGNLDYLTDMSAGRETHVFKYADETSLFFNCQIRIGPKDATLGYCERPVCQDPVKGRKRSVESTAMDNETAIMDVDVSTRRITVEELPKITAEDLSGAASNAGSSSSLCFDIFPFTIAVLLSSTALLLCFALVLILHRKNKILQREKITCLK